MCNLEQPGFIDTDNAKIQALHCEITCHGNFTRAAVRSLQTVNKRVSQLSVEDRVFA